VAIFSYFVFLSLKKNDNSVCQVFSLIQLRQDSFKTQRLFMDKTTKEQVKISPDSPLWEELSDEAADACVGGVGGQLAGLLNHGDLSGYLEQAQRNRRIYRYLFRNS
jgi:hypothetical protein